MMLVCGSEVHGRATELLRTRSGERAARNMNSPPFTWMTRLSIPKTYAGAPARMWRKAARQSANANRVRVIFCSESPNDLEHISSEDTAIDRKIIFLPGLLRLLACVNNERLVGKWGKAALRLVFALYLFTRLQLQPFSGD